MPRTPHYQRIVEDIRSRIASGDLQPGDQLPSIAQLMTNYEVGSTAVHNAMLVLKAEGLVEGHQGKGVFVTRRPTWAGDCGNSATVR